MIFMGVDWSNIGTIGGWRVSLIVTEPCSQISGFGQIFVWQMAAVVGKTKHIVICIWGNIRSQGYFHWVAAIDHTVENAGTAKSL